MLESIDKLASELEGLRSRFNELLGLVIVNNEGLVLFSSLADGEDEGAYADAVGECLLSGTRIASIFNAGGARAMMLSFEDNFFIYRPLELGFALFARFSSEVRPGLALTSINLIAHRLNAMLKGTEPVAGKEQAEGNK